MNNRWRTVVHSTPILLLAMLAVGVTWSFGYHRGFDRGYAQGGREEFLRWKQEPTRIDRSWDGTIVGRRMREPAKPFVSPSRPWPVNAWSSPFKATSSVNVSTSAGPAK
jgi:hypothetical protein